MTGEQIKNINFDKLIDYLENEVVRIIKDKQAMKK